MEYVPSVKWGFFPLDEELGLLPGSLTPRLQDDLTHLGTWMPFPKAVKTLKRFRGVEISEATGRRHTEGNGAAYVAVQDAEVARIEQGLPPAPAGPAKQLLSVDGTMVPLVGGEGAEVKTLVLGEIEEPVLEKGEWVVHARNLSYFSRLADAETFAQLALVEAHRRGVETARQVIAVTDGAEWEQGFIDYHRADAVRVLDFPHAGEHIGRMGAAVWGVNTPATKQWVSTHMTHLKHQGPAVVLPELRALTDDHPDLPELAGCLAYLEKREAHMQYPLYQAEGWPIGSGAVESSHNLIVEVRLGGAGMHWARSHVNPMLGLRNAVCNDRWDEAWSEISQYRQQQIQHRRQARREQHLADSEAASAHASSPVIELLTSSPATVAAEASAKGAYETVASAPVQSQHPRRPAPDHPWRKYPACTPRRRQQPHSPDART